MNKKILIIICGPTAVGKTSVAIQLAKELNTQIISADSRQFFKEMNIGTAKPTAEEIAQVKHHFIDSLSVTDEYNVGMFERDALRILKKLFSEPETKDRKPQTVIMVGGSGLYINAVLNGFDEVPQADKELRANLSALYKEFGIEELQNQLKRLDPEHYRKIDIKNPHRLIRAIEVCMITGKKYSELRSMDNGKLTIDTKKRSFTPIKIGLELGREELYARINARVDKMMRDGLVEEVKTLKAHRHRNSLHTVGYKEVFDFFEGKQDLSRTIELIKQNTRNYAKRQLTWFKKDKEINWFNAHNPQEVIDFVKKQLNAS